MYSIKENIENTIYLKKSKFITKLYKVNSIIDINETLKLLKQKYSDCSHMCYGYIINNIEKCSDDGEPNGTAGIPILNVLKKNNLTCILAVVIRYFGGIKLGAGGLTRAYSNCVIETINKSNIVELEKGYLIEIEFNYNNIKLINNILKDKNIIDKIYKNNVIYKLYLNESDLNYISKLNDIIINISIKDSCLIEKEFN